MASKVATTDATRELVAQRGSAASVNSTGADRRARWSPARHARNGGTRPSARRR
jgi:hypothetical protein